MIISPSLLIEDFSKRGQKLVTCTFYLLFCSIIKIVNGYMTRTVPQSLRLFVVQMNINWLLYQLTLEGKLPVWSRTCTANEWLHQDDISASQPFWSLATEAFLVVISFLHWCILKQSSLDAQVDWLMTLMAKDHTHFIIHLALMCMFGSSIQGSVPDPWTALDAGL